MNGVSLKLKALVDGQALGLFSLSCEHRAVTERGGKLPKEEKKAWTSGQHHCGNDIYFIF